MSSSDEGEIVEDNGGNLKASSLPCTQGSSVDRRDRLPNRDSPDRDSQRTRSPRGYKRGRDDYDARSRRRDVPGPSRSDRDSRERRDDHKRSRISYDDLDRSSGRGLDSRDIPNRSRDRSRDHYNDKDRDRRHSRSPPHRSHHNDHSSGRNGRGGRRISPGRRNHGLDYDNYRDSTMASSESRWRTGASVPPAANADAKSHKHSSETGAAARADPATKSVHFAEFDSSGVLTSSREQPAADSNYDYDNQEEFDEEAEIERRRKRRGALLAKSSSATPLLLQAVGATEKVRAASPTVSDATIDVETPQTPQSTSHHAMSPGRLDLTDDRALMNSHAVPKDDEDDGPSAADYDPTVDMRVDEQRDGLRQGHAVNGIAQAEQNGVEAKDARADEDEDDGFDMFADDFDEEKYATMPAQGDEVAANTGKGGILEGDDKDGYYKMRVGEIINGRYQIQSTLGRGMFSGVVQALDTTTKMPVAIKIMRNNDALRKGGYTEIAILEKLNDADPENRKHIVKFEVSFDYRGHLCMVFESLSMNLREVLRKFGNNVGINLSATRTYAYQIFVSLAHMRKCSIIHADLKPDNILVNENRSMLKICDLGTAIDRSDAATAHTEITPYLVSRFYRAPEIILGMSYDYGVDMWSIGCTLYELYTGKILFTGDSNNQMLKAIMEIRGRFTPKLYKRGQLSAGHFDDLGQFVSVEHDKLLNKVVRKAGVLSADVAAPASNATSLRSQSTRSASEIPSRRLRSQVAASSGLAWVHEMAGPGQAKDPKQWIVAGVRANVCFLFQTAVRTLPVVKPTRDLRTRLMAASAGMNDAETKDLNHFVDLLEQCLALNPDKRIKPTDALKHPFFTSRASSVKR
ncbi:serine/threonine protein kinase (Prp4), putative [Cordyceps militaris CM01]|uniref:non-specific serine/threonine protein kinase n=1 Tax=Cordyceps militaris (strain CM01) TaxID=983644 RepID=G3J5H8_CORMM|nr:serine/threonine protein kinase (Prp4), putative [Cordyceps militaris CM01]EGX96039.1 serine/threonine protein kinase (Prp4), putative [Cordyceps militaris CM01]